MHPLQTPSPLRTPHAGPLRASSLLGTAGEKGTGFGLPMSHDIVKAHGGELTVETELGKGTSFFLHLPESPTSHPL